MHSCTIKCAMFVDPSEIRNLQNTQRRAVDTVPGDPTPGTSRYDIQAMELGSPEMNTFAEVSVH